jgi:hypothetical protein
VVATVGGVVGILSTVGAFDEAPPERATVEVGRRVTSGVTQRRWNTDHGDLGAQPRTYSGLPGGEGHGFQVRVALDHPAGKRYGLRWTALDTNQVRPLPDSRDVVWRTYSREEADGLHYVWVPCPPLDAFRYFVRFELTNESRAGTPRIGSDDSTPVECRNLP